MPAMTVGPTFVESSALQRYRRVGRTQDGRPPASVGFLAADDRPVRDGVPLAGERKVDRERSVPGVVRRKDALDLLPRKPSCSRALAVGVLVRGVRPLGV